MKTLCLTLLLVLLINISSFSQQYHNPYFPMELGKKWSYTSQESQDTLETSIVDTATIMGKYYYVFAPNGPNSNLPRYWLRTDPNHIFALNMQDTTEYILFNFNAQLNESWNIPPDSSRYNVPVNQCDWGKTISLFSNSTTVVNTNNVFYNCFVFNHFEHPCFDAGILKTCFENDYGIVRFSQVTEGGVLDWDLMVEEPDTVSIIGKYSIIGNPCLTVPCIPGVVSAVETNDTTFILESGGLWFWNGDFSWNEYFPSYGDSVIVTGIITNRTDLNGRKYSTIEIINFSFYTVTSLTNKNSKNETPHYILKQNYPNPFNSLTKIEYVLSEPCNVKMNIYDSAGRLVKTIGNNYKSSGNYHLLFDGKELSSGIYFYQLITDNTIKTKSMILLK